MGRRRTRLHAPSQRRQYITNVVFSSRLLYGAAESESWFSLELNTSSLQHEASRQPCGLLQQFPCLNLDPIFCSFLFSFLFFCFSPSPLRQGTVPALTNSALPLYSSFSESVPRSLAYLMLFERGDVATCGCASLLRCTELKVICTAYQSTLLSAHSILI